MYLFPLSLSANGPARSTQNKFRAQEICVCELLWILHIALGSVAIGFKGVFSEGQIFEFLWAQWTHSLHFFRTHFSPPYIQNR